MKTPVPVESLMGVATNARISTLARIPVKEIRYTNGIGQPFMVFLVNLHQAIIIGGADNIRLEVAFVADQGHQESEINFIGIRHPINIFLKAYNMGGSGASKLWDQGIYQSKYSQRVIGYQETYIKELNGNDQM